MPYNGCMALLFTVFIVLGLLLVNEWWWRKARVGGELSRKFIHITVGSFVAFWPLFLSWQEIRLLSLAFLVTVLVSKQLGLFQAIHSVQRPTWGEIYFAAAVGLVTYITTDPAVYTASLLTMSLGDGLAAVFGKRFGRSNKYRIFGHSKSLVGTATFFVASLLILVSLNPYLPMRLDLLAMLVISLLASLVENAGVRGLDNLLVPLGVALILANL